MQAQIYFLVEHEKFKSSEHQVNASLVYSAGSKYWSGIQTDRENIPVKFTHRQMSIFNSIKWLRLSMYRFFLGHFSLHQVPNVLFQDFALILFPPLPSMFHHPPFISRVYHKLPFPLRMLHSMFLPFFQALLSPALAPSLTSCPAHFGSVHLELLHVSWGPPALPWCLFGTA